ncbi:iron-sulfur cluster biosynthesis family protein [Enterococcus plantarum]|uniref:iron-sulfur cluster biosynthesis family protein n=1 Tax=Enterococcus plantarum TaxID=1077675 RepID=UPI001A8C297C|nr:iron-sulfur cluster biosynthesis family protein [Enterococcus plantarum]MBO0467108.1 iron-sulfur cluster biosynthesis family protein [Enterococcus plantarum]
MYLKISNEAQVKLTPYIESKAVIILDLDDGVGNYSKMGVCSLDTSFRLLVLDQVQDKSDFGLTVDSDMGAICIKDYSKRYLDEEMILEVDPRLQVFKLKSPSGVLDGNVPIVDLRPEKGIS